MSLVSIILPTYNRAALLPRAIDSALNQTFRDFELLVVDDGSTDGSRAVLEKYGDCISAYYQENRGVSAARNTGIGNSKGELICFIDSDDEWLPKKLEKQAAFMSLRPDCMICQTRERWIRKGKRVNIPDSHKKISGNIFAQSLKKCMVTASSVMLRRALFDEAGLFDESLPACEDYNLWLRIAHKYPVELLDEELLIRYGGHADQLSSKYFGNDRYRIRSILYILEHCNLNAEQRELAINELKRKCRIYAQGCRKRGKNEEAERYLRLN